MLGSRAAAEDAVQEAFARWYAAPRDSVRSEGALLTTMVTRICIDQLKSAQAKREVYVGEWLPEPLETQAGAATMPIDLESISYAFLTLLQTLTPLERAVYLLREVFGYSHGEVARMTGREEAAVRQLHHRAREAILARRPRFAANRSEHERLVAGFVAACRSGDFDGLHALLADEAVLRSDGGGKAPAISRPLRGAAPIAKAYTGFARMAPAGTKLEVREVNGWPAVAVWVESDLRSVISFETDGARILAIYAMVNPEKLARLASAWTGS